MVARSRMGGPWSRAQRVARAFRDAGHEVTLAWGDDGNCANPIAPALEIPVPSPLGLPEA
ncbi:MAG: glycosyl transferase family 1, partial [Schaalia odontolytica]|nr:glycosyl transferase family 1 [Schaalia odontolytica]